MNGNKQQKLPEIKRQQLLREYYQDHFSRTLKDFADKYGLSVRQIGRIVRNESRYKGPK